MTLPAPLADEQLLRLEELLADASLPNAMRLDEAHGYLCAARSGPRPMAEEEWLSAVLGSANEVNPALLDEASELLRRFVARLEAELAQGEPPVPLLYPAEGEGNEASDYVAWCMGYLCGVDEASEDWFDALGADENTEASDEIAYLDEQLFPLFMLTGDAEAAALEAGEDWLSGDELERLRTECEEGLPQAVTNIYRFWVAQRGIGTIRRESPKVGRNDPCPCGSGRKYKRCCGS